MDLNIKQNKKLRDKNYIRIINRYIQSYIKNPFGDLSLWSLPINKLPNNLSYIDGYLDIRWTNISELPRGLVINGNLYIIYTNISELPDDISIEGSLYCYNTPLGSKYSNEELRKKYNIKGDIYGDYY